MGTFNEASVSDGIINSVVSSRTGIGSYVVATEAGVRLQYNNGLNKHSITVTKTGVFVDGNAIGSVPIWGGWLNGFNS